MPSVRWDVISSARLWVIRWHLHITGKCGWVRCALYSRLWLWLSYIVLSGAPTRASIPERVIQFFSAYWMRPKPDNCACSGIPIGHTRDVCSPPLTIKTDWRDTFSKCNSRYATSFLINPFIHNISLILSNTCMCVLRCGLRQEFLNCFKKLPNNGKFFGLLEFLAHCHVFEACNYYRSWWLLQDF